MKVVRCGILGFCMGVRRAAALAAGEAQKMSRSGDRVYMLGPLIHNPAVLADLKKQGIEELSQPPQNLKGCSLIIRAHGIDPRLEEDMRSRGGRIVDATCPRVKASQLKAKELVQEGFTLFLAGEMSHAEISGILGYADNYGSPHARVVSNAAEAQAAAQELYNANKNAKTALIGQTTISEEEYRVIGEAIKNHFPDIQIVQTLCAATRDRQQSLRELLPEVEAVIVAGGRESANTRCLFAIAQESGKPCAIVETADEIPHELYAYETVGLCAGASTPDFVIDEIERGCLNAY